ncbi:hypothetical protein ECE25_17155, partial [Acinetobacter baumannii]
MRNERPAEPERVGGPPDRAVSAAGRRHHPDQRGRHRRGERAGGGEAGRGQGIPGCRGIGGRPQEPGRGADARPPVGGGGGGGDG